VLMPMPATDRHPRGISLRLGECSEMTPEVL
jgi:hypothetical protein